MAGGQPLIDQESDRIKRVRARTVSCRAGRQSVHDADRCPPCTTPGACGDEKRCGRSQETTNPNRGSGTPEEEPKRICCFRGLVGAQGGLGRRGSFRTNMGVCLRHWPKEEPVFNIVSAWTHPPPMVAKASYLGRTQTRECVGESLRLMPAKRRQRPAHSDTHQMTWPRAVFRSRPHLRRRTRRRAT